MAESKVDLGAGASLLNQDPSYDYPMNPLLPFASRNTMDVDQLSTDYMKGDIKLIVPPILADMLNASVRGGQMLRNEAPLTSEGIASIALDTLPSSALVSGITRDAAMAGPGTVLGMNVFHGTPHVFKPEPGFPQGRPRLDKMGTGEGAQKYGRGFYSAEAGGVGGTYRDALSYKETVQKFREALPDNAEIQDVTSLLGTGHFSPSQEAVIRALAADDWLGFDYPGQAISAAYSRNLDNWDPSPALKEAVKSSGNLYKLDIPDADVAKLLDYDAPISAQPKVVQDAITKLGFMPDNPDKMAGGDIWFRMRQQLGEQEAADAMRAAGVPGLRYRDAGSRGKTDSEGTRNFVVWDQDVLDRTKVLQRNDEKFSRALESFKYGGEVERPMGIESGMADSKVDLGAGAPEGYSFGIAGYGVRPRVFVEGRQTGSTPSVALPEGDVLLDIINQNYYGKIGVDVTSPGGDTFGGAASGSYYRGSVDYPEELQRYGAPDRETYSARGIQSPEYSGYYQMKDGPRFEGYYRDMPKGSDMPDEYGGRVSYTIPFEDGGEVERGFLERAQDYLSSGQLDEDARYVLGPHLYPPVKGLADLAGVVSSPADVKEMFDASGRVTEAARGADLAGGIGALGDMVGSAAMLALPGTFGGAKKSLNEFFENMGEEGVGQEFPEIFQSIERYIYDVDASGINDALKSADYPLYREVLEANLNRSFPGDTIPVQRTENYLMQRDPRTGDITRGPRDKKIFEVAKEDVLLAGNEGELELIIDGAKYGYDGTVSVRAIESFKYGGEVEPVGIEKSVTITQSIPANDPRSMALGSRLLKQAGVPGDFNSVLKNADPRVVAQVNRIMPKSKVAAPSTGIGLFMGLKQG